MTAPRTPLARWRYPESQVLLEQVFPSGKPPFAPFPSVTNILNACLCPVAASHDLLKGDESALLGKFEERRFGNLFHGFVAHLKRQLIEGGARLPERNPGSAEGTLRSLFFDYAQRHGFFASAAGDLWQQGTDVWVRRQLSSGNLGALQNGDQVEFEVTIANPRMTLALDGGSRSYPLQGRADELDISRKRIIERTLKPPLGEKPPLLKDLQGWLLWKALSTLPKSHLPHAWRAVPFKEFEIIVETPERDFTVEKDFEGYLTAVHHAYAWIHDLSVSEQPGVLKEVQDNAACSPASPHPECSHKWTNCFTRTFPHPASRPEMKRIFRPWYRLLLWERMWQGDLWWYQTLMLETKELVEQGLVSTGRIISSTPEKTEIKVEAGEPNRAGGYDMFTVVPFGTLFCGKRVDARLLEVSDGRLTMKFGDEDGRRIGNALLLPPAPDAAAVFQRRPEHLLSQAQQGLFRVQKFGVIKDDVAASFSQVQLLEGIFGPKAVKGRKK